MDITAYIDGLSDNKDKVIITNSFGGEIQAQHILNIQGSGPTRKMLKENIEKIFLIPFFKIFEIFYISFDDEKKYNDLKEKNFGKNFENLKLLKPFEKQIQTLNELLYLTRQDILWKLEKQFIEKYVNNKLDNDKMIFLNNMLERYYNQAMKVLLEQKINCLSPESGSIAEKVFSSKKIEKGYEKKLFMCNRSCFNYDNIILNKLDNSYVKDFFMENLIKAVLNNIENDINQFLKNNKEDGNKFKNFLNNNIGKFYKEKIIPNCYFISTLILSSIESGDQINFNHNIDKNKISSIFFYPFIWLKPYGEDRAKYEMDFKRLFLKDEIEKINMRNLFIKRKIKNIVKSNLSWNDQTKHLISKSSKNSNTDENDIKRNKTYNFSKYSENQIFGEEYYENFLDLLNNYSNEFKEDLEISIYENLREENKLANQNYLMTKEMMNDLINDEESKKGFLALLRQSFLLGKLRSEIVSINHI